MTTGSITQTTFEEVLNSQKALEELAAQQVPVALAQKIIKLRVYLEDHVFRKFRHHRDETAAKFGTAVENSDPPQWRLDAKSTEKLRAEILVFVKSKVSIPPALRISLQELNEVKISANSLETIVYAIDGKI